MLKHLEEPMEARLMTIEDAMEVAPLHDMYNFRKGYQLCDQVVKECFQDKKKILSDLDCFVDAVLLADAANHNEAKNVGVTWLYKTFRSMNSHTVGGIIFTKKHIRKLVTLIIKKDDLYQIVASSFRGRGIKSKEDLRSLRCFRVRC
jgi:hypothetical protein